MVSGKTGEQLRLGDIATVVDGFEDVALRGRFDGRSSALVNVFRTGEQDTMLLAKGVRDYIENVTITRKCDCRPWLPHHEDCKYRTADPTFLITEDDEQRGC